MVLLNVEQTSGHCRVRSIFRCLKEWHCVIHDGELFTSNEGYCYSIGQLFKKKSKDTFVAHMKLLTFITVKNTVFYILVDIFL